MPLNDYMLVMNIFYCVVYIYKKILGSLLIYSKKIEWNIAIVLLT